MESSILSNFPLDNPQLIPFVTIFLWSMLMGGFGGYLQHLSSISRKEYGAQGSAKPNRGNNRASHVDVLLGMGGSSVAIALVGASRIGDLSQLDVFGALALTGLFITSGYSGRRIVEVAASRLREELRDTQSRLDHTEDEADRALEAVHDIREKLVVSTMEARLEYLIQDARRTIDSGTKLERLQLLRRFEEFQHELRERSDVPHSSRRVAIQWARNYRRLDELEEAIGVLTRYLDEWENVASQEDLSDVYYQRACYQCQQYKELIETDHPTAEKYKDKCLRDLEKSLSLDPENLKEAIEDNDFEPVWNEERFKELTQQQ